MLGRWSLAGAIMLRAIDTMLLIEFFKKFIKVDT